MSQPTTHLLLDAAQVGIAMKEGKELNEEHSSLYKGQSREDLTEFAPYIFSIDKKTPFGNWFITNGWGNSWGILLQSLATAKDVYRHFRKFLLIQTEDGQELYFRFYDPRVLRIFLPTCDAAQLSEFFGPVQSFTMEDEDPAFGLQFWLENGQLRKRQISREKIANTLLSE